MKKQTIYKALVILAILLAAIQPSLAMFDNIRYLNLPMEHTLFWYQMLFGVDSSMMLRVVLPVLFIWFGLRDFYNQLHKQSFVEHLTDSAFNQWVNRQVYKAWAKLSILLLLYMSIVFVLPFLLGDGAGILLSFTGKDILFILWYMLSTLLLGLILINIFVLISRTNKSFITSILIIIVASFFIDPIIRDFNYFVMIDVNKSMFEWLSQYPVEDIIPYQMESSLFYPITLFLNATVFGLSFFILSITFTSSQEQLDRLRTT